MYICISIPIADRSTGSGFTFRKVGVIIRVFGVFSMRDVSFVQISNRLKTDSKHRIQFASDRPHFLVELF